MTRAAVAVAGLVALVAAGCEKPLKPGDPVRGLTATQRDRFTRGKVVFEAPPPPGR